MSPKRKRVTDRLIATAIVASGLAYLVYSEVSYARLIAPEDFGLITDFYDQFEQPSHASELSVNGEIYYELWGPLPPKWSIAVPSAPPAYVFDAQGKFVDWCRDPGDSPSWRRRWTTDGAKRLSDAEIRRYFNIGP